MSIRESLKEITGSFTKFTSNLLGYFTAIKDFFVEHINNFKQHIKNLRVNLKDLKGTNIALAWYHIKHGNINDAIVRFKIIDTLISPNDKEVFYGMGWCYFLKKNEAKALEYLEKAKEEDKIGLKAFLTNNAEVIEAPSNILEEYRKVTAESYIKKWANEPKELPKLFVKALFAVLEELPKNCRMLDLGCSFGIIGAEVDYILEKNYHLVGVDNIEELTSYAKLIREDKRKVYDELINLSAKQFLNSNNDEKYDIIASFLSLNFVADIEPYLLKIRKILDTNGHFALFLQTSDKSFWDKWESSFVYSEDEIKEKLKLAEFKILDIKEWRLNRNTTYTMFIATK